MRALWLSIFALLLASRLCHWDVLWIEEAYPTAAAAELLRGKVLYKDIWFDKPPLFAGIYALWGAYTGLALRVAGAVFGLLTSWAAARAARAFWGPREAAWAAAFTAFFLTFDTPSATLALTPDLLTVPLHFAAAALAFSGFPLLAGLCAGVSVLFNAKGLLILAACLLWQLHRAHVLALGFAIPVLAAAGWMAFQGSFSDYWQQVWVWGAAYSRDTLVASPLLEGVRRTVNWSWFHLALIAGMLVASWDEKDMRWPAWLLFSLAGVFLGLRFFPRYFFHLLPVVALLAARGFARLSPKRAAALALLLVIPLARYGPRYVQLVQGQPWSDLAMLESSRKAADFIKSRTHSGDTLFVWGYRPDLYPLSGLPAGTRFLDSQPLSGVIADRHLVSSQGTFPGLARANREALLHSPRPTWVADGLGPYNPALDVRTSLPEIMAEYVLTSESPGYRIYRLAR
ncbi:MAG: hypothetical protein HZB13_13670 [Acidobacteria bacterium]|nr:hypothetical protein [Acidobacteriota bacterium]